ncbi:MAG: amidohydrolase family protein [Alcanivorax sp.]|nr:amidohydrolase family protein [Alcanivorax sp.]
MALHVPRGLIMLCIAALALSGCGSPPPSPFAGATAWTGARIWTGEDEGYLEDATLIVREGKVLALHRGDVPDDVEIRDVSGHYLIPGLINAHGHVGMARGLETGPTIHSRENVEAQLRLYARYGITTVISLGDEPPEAFAVRDTQVAEQPGMARLFLAGEVLDPPDAASARSKVEALMRMNPDWVKIRVDDHLGTEEKMAPDVYGAVIDASHEFERPLASHMVTLEDAKGLLRAGTNLIAHSVRDAPVDNEMIELMREGDICITPTLTREVSTFVYAERPAFFDDPFFIKAADPEVLEALQEPDMQARFTGRAANYYRAALPLAKANMLTLHEAGVRVAMGTDSGPPARFQGYFEHMEMAMMQEAGMTPLEILISATQNAADCSGVGDAVGTLAPGKWADFLLLDADPMDDIRHLRRLAGIALAGHLQPFDDMPHATEHD